MTDPLLPRQGQALTGPNDLTTSPFYTWFAAVDRALRNGTLSTETLTAQLEAQAAQIEAIEPGLPLSTSVTGADGIDVVGSLAAGAAIVSLEDLADAGGGTLQKTMRDAKGRLSGTSAATTTDLAEGTNLYFTDARARAAVAVPKGYIDGLTLQWVSGTALTASSGEAYIEGSGYIVPAPSAIAKTSLSLSASTWYHVYLYLNAGVPDIEIVTTAPVAYSGTARSKTGDTSRRYLGSVRTDAASNILGFQHSGSTVSYGGLDNSLHGVLGGGTSTTAATVSLTTLLPVTATHAGLFLANVANATCGTSFPGAPLALGFGAGQSYIGYAGGSNDVSFSAHPVSSSQTIDYMYASAITNGGALYINVFGYTFGR